MRIAVDVMGSDLGPAVVTRGALKALEGFPPDVSMFFVGNASDIEPVVKASPLQSRCSIIPTTQVVGMGEHPVEALKSKPDSSIVKAVGLVKEGKADAIVSAGSTGAQVAASTLMLGLLPGVRRAGLVALIPSLKGRFALIDVGANVSCKPLHLYQYGVMASLFMGALLDIPEPKVGLLSIGEERSKGSALIKDAYAALEASSLNFKGNCEGHEIFHGGIDVVVCDGFVGNVVLKVAEGMAEIMFASLKEAATQTGIIKEPGFQKAAGALKQRFDWKEAGGAQLLGVGGISVIAHGRSDEAATAGAIRIAHKIVAADLNRKIVSALEKTPMHISE
ncbi:MAG: phosphate acyltransferase PlsX [Planctomycetes bacterium]|nr:phosphate acyltransferase PlsX [Planctomycetota bacterium]NUQ35321.1 phosphate acyltransferase PlsX [Planctomycetaceae bacterium]